MAGDIAKTYSPEQYAELKRIRKESQILLGRKLSQIRAERNLSRAAVTARIGVTPTALAKWEKGLSDITISDAIKLCSVLKVEPDALCDRSLQDSFFPESTVGQRIGFARSAAYLKQETLGALIGVTRSTISKWENGLMTPRISEICEIAKSCGCSPSFLMLGAEPKELKNRVRANEFLF